MKLRLNFTIAFFCMLSVATSLNAQYGGPVLGEYVSLSACTTIDLDKDSRGFSSCAKKALAKAQIILRSNNDPTGSKNRLTQSFANLASCSMSDTAMVIGHGQSGEVRVGGGDYEVPDKCKDIMHIADIQDIGGVQWNPSTWAPLAKNIKSKFKTVILLGCQTGRNPYGKELVVGFSSAVDARTKAPTSKVWCDSHYQLRLERGARWTEAKEGKLKMGRDPSLGVEFLLRGRAEIIRFPVNELNVYDTYEPHRVQSISRCVNKTPYHSASPCREIHNREQLLNSILFDKPLQPHAVPNAELTGAISLTVCPNDDNKECVTRDFDVLNDDMVADKKTRTYYYVTESFTNNWFKVE